jgi:hypothetical protein
MSSETQFWLFAMSVGASAFGGMLGMAADICKQRLREK